MAKDDDQDQETPQQRAARIMRNLDEGATMMSFHLPSLWRQLYIRLQGEGFDEAESLSLVKTYILSQAPAGVHVHKG